MQDKVIIVASEIEGVPTEIQLVPYGYHDTVKGPFLLNEEGMEAVIAAFESQKNDMVIDYEHQTLYGVEAPAAGWIKKLVNKGKEGLWAVVEWTDRAKEYLRNREYRYLSPVILARPRDSLVMRVKNAGLTNAPAIDGMVPIVNKGTGGDSSTAAQQRNSAEVSRKEKSKMLKKLIRLLALKEDATEEQVMEAVKGLAGHVRTIGVMKESLKLKPEATAQELQEAILAMNKRNEDKVPGGVLEALGLKDNAGLSEVTGTIQAMKAGHEQSGELAEKVGDLETKLRKREAEEMVDAAMKDGKVIPAQREFFLAMAEKDPAQFQAYVKVAAKQIVTDEVAGKETEDTDKRETLIMEHMKANEGCTYKDAVLTVSKKHPELFKDR